MPSSSPAARPETFSDWNSRMASCKSATKALRGMMCCVWVQFREARLKVHNLEDSGSWVKWGKEENEYGTSVMVVLCRTTKRTDYVIQIENRVGVTLEYEYAHLSMRRSVSL